MQMNSCDTCLSKREDVELVKGLYGSEFDKNRACAFCRHHHCYLTVKQVKQHNCLVKQCWYLRKNENHDWWRQREVMKQKRKARKERGNLYAI
jgi:hypothetical protein